MTFSTEQDISIAGVILAGGLATRMGGGDKTQKVIGNRKILNIVIERISPQV
ncbi:MAG: NTP transferase domain-containing protein, partial [Rhodobacteraceae bacterium]|nr:NTP transferase domain-containing protein [Paracoccaceae bacterium]